MSRMATESQPFPLAGRRPSARSGIAWCAAVLAGSAVLGLLGGLVWEQLAPRAMLQEIGTGTAELINAETRAFITADVWFCGIAVVAGLLTGVLGYRFAVSRREGATRALVVACLIIGGLVGALVMLWLGERLGQSGYYQHLASSPNGTVFPATLALGARSALAFWPMLTAIVLLVAEWGAGSGPDPAEPAVRPEPTARPESAAPPEPGLAP